MDDLLPVECKYARSQIERAKEGLGDTDQIVERLTIWDKDYGIEIEGADSDWVDIKFLKLPNDIKKLAEEIYELCPDSVDQGVGSMRELETYLLENNGVFLWWD